MIPFKIGNWLINEEGISHSKDDDYLISRERIVERGPQDRRNIFDWLVHMPTKSWCTREDIYALNTAFFYAIEAYGISYSSDISFVKTIVMQEKILEQNTE